MTGCVGQDTTTSNSKLERPSPQNKGTCLITGDGGPLTTSIHSTFVARADIKLIPKSWLQSGSFSYAVNFNNGHAQPERYYGDVRTYLPTSSSTGLPERIYIQSPAERRVRTALPQESLRRA
jgi:hypothetical protein